MKYDAIIIGFGKGGKTLAGALAKRGKTVALIEKSTGMYGGTCINVGCIPSKSLVRSSNHVRLHTQMPFAEKAAAYKAAIAEKRRLTAMLRQKNYAKLNALSNVTIFDAAASFLSPTKVRLETSQGAEILEGDKIFINTGSTSALPKIPGLSGNPRVFTSETLMELESLPRQLTIIGGGYIGLEFASIYAGFGSAVTVLQDGAAFIPREDRDIAAEIQKALESMGVRFVFSAQTQAIEGANVRYLLDGAAHTLTGDAVLIATGRRPNTDALQAKNAGVELTPRGAVKVDETLRTTAPNIWALGDVCGGLQFTYISMDDCRIVLSQLYGDQSRRTSNRSHVPYSVFLSPAFSRVGLNEKEALEQSRKIKIAQLPAMAIPKAQVLQQPVGLLKAIVDADTNKILGAMLFCEASYELINLVKIAMDLDADYTALRDAVYTHPTMTEALNDLFDL